MNDWFQTVVGQSVIAEEIDKCAQLIPSTYYARSLQVGFSGVDFLQKITVSNRFIVDIECHHNPQNKTTDVAGFVSQATHCHHAVSLPSALPFPEKTQDLIVLPHTLELCENPHEVLRQADQILVPEGCLVITGFNLFSIYGAVKSMKFRSNTTPWAGHYYRLGRVQDWLSLLGYDLVGAGLISYRPPLQSKKWHEKMAFIEKVGDRWWPGLGGVYVIVSRKREMALTSLQKHTLPWHKLIPTMAQPASQRAAKIGMTLVGKNREASD